MITIDKALFEMEVDGFPKYFGFGDSTPDHSDCLGFVYRGLIKMGYDTDLLNIPRTFTSIERFIEIMAEIESVPGDRPLCVWKVGKFGHIGLINSRDDVYSFNLGGKVQIDRYDPTVHLLYGVPKVLGNPR